MYTPTHVNMHILFPLTKLKPNSLVFLKVLALNWVLGWLSTNAYFWNVLLFCSPHNNTTHGLVEMWLRLLSWERSAKYVMEVSGTWQQDREQEPSGSFLWQKEFLASDWTYKSLQFYSLISVSESQQDLILNLYTVSFYLCSTDYNSLICRLRLVVSRCTAGVQTRPPESNRPRLNLPERLPADVRQVP